MWRAQPRLSVLQVVAAAAAEVMRRPRLLGLGVGMELLARMGQPEQWEQGAEEEELVPWLPSNALLAVLCA